MLQCCIFGTQYMGVASTVHVPEAKVMAKVQVYARGIVNKVGRAVSGLSF